MSDINHNTRQCAPGSSYAGEPFASIVVELEGRKYKLRLGSEGRPYVLFRLVEGPNYRSAKSHWERCWAEWYKGLPAGKMRRAVAAAGFVWRSDSAEALGWHKAD